MFKNHKVAFVASGGSGRGIAHAGVMRACHKVGIKFDILIGASAGAIGAILYNQHAGDTDKMVDNFRPTWKRKYNFPQFNWGKLITLHNFFNKRIKSGLFDLSKAEEFLRANLITDDFNQLPIPTYISATNLEDHVGEFFGPGINDHVPISKALVASCCVPVLFRPVKIGSHYYVDGEIKRPLALEMAIEKGADIVIMSDVYTPYVKGIGTSGMFNILGQIMNMLLEDKSMRGVKICQEHFPDKKVILISPPVGDIGAFDTSKYEQLERAGYNAAMRVLSEEVDE